MSFINSLIALKNSKRNVFEHNQNKINNKPKLQTMKKKYIYKEKIIRSYHDNYDLARKTYFDLMSKYCLDKNLIYKKWNKILFHYKANYRDINYKINHIQEVILKFALLKDRVKHWDAFLITLYYYDVIHSDSALYDAEKSMEFAKSHLFCLSVPIGVVHYALQLIDAVAHPQCKMDKFTQYAVDLIISARYKKKII